MELSHVGKNLSIEIYIITLTLVSFSKNIYCDWYGQMVIRTAREMLEIVHIIRVYPQGYSPHNVLHYLDMSFGFSISDFLSLANVTLQIYDALRTGSAECKASSKDMLLFHEILQKLGRDLQAGTCDVHDRAILWGHGLACHRFLWTEVLENGLLNPQYNLDDIYELESYEEYRADPRCRGWIDQIKRLKPSALYQVQATIRNARFSRKIPKLQRLVTAQIEKLTAYNVLLMQSSQTRMESAQARIEASQKLVGDGQLRMESMLRDFLATQQRNGTSTTSCSLDSSSPEGIDACRSLCRALRKEGIAPKKIKDSQQILVEAMKRILGTSEAEAQSLASTFCSSYRTAPEYIDNSILSCSRDRASAFMDMSQGFMPSSAEVTMSIYCSAPPTAPKFPQAFLERSTPRALEAEDDLNDCQDHDSDGSYTKSYSADNGDSEYAEAERVGKTDFGPDLSRTSGQHRSLDIGGKETTWWMKNLGRFE